MALITLIVLGLISSLVFWWLRANRDKWTPPDDKSNRNGE
jgi:hypothetical protein